MKIFNRLYLRALSLAALYGCLVVTAAAQSSAPAQGGPVVYCRDPVRHVVTRSLSGDCAGEIVDEAQAAAARSERAARVRRALGGADAPASAAPGASAGEHRSGRRAIAGVPGLRRVCPADSFDGNCDYDSLSQALAALRDGETLTMRAGDYKKGGVVAANRVTIKAESGARLTSAAVEGKAALVVRGNDVVIEGLEIAHVKASSGNGAAIRGEGKNLTLRHVYFHHNQMNLLTGGPGGVILIEDSRFEDSLGSDGQLGHNIYIAGNSKGYPDAFILRRTQVLRTGGRGHGVKSRAMSTVIEDCILAGLEGEYSRSIDIPMGGKLLIRRNIIEHGPKAENWDVIGLGLETLHENVQHEARIEENIVIGDRDENVFITHRSPGPVILRNNVLVGPFKLTAKPEMKIAGGDSTKLFASRAKASMPPYPGLPAKP